jgi:hypothetical protein
MDIDKITLQYLSNSKNKNILNNQNNQNHINEDDLSFYKHRITNLTNELLTNLENNNIDVDTKQSFLIYVNACIKYFKLSDTNTIIQQEHLCVLNSEQLSSDPDNTPLYNNNNNNNIQDNSKQITYNIDNFIIRNKPNKKLIPQIILPKQKDININTTDLRYKIDIPSINDVTNIPSYDIILPQQYFEVI